MCCHVISCHDDVIYIVVTKSDSSSYSRIIKPSYKFGFLVVYIVGFVVHTSQRAAGRIRTSQMLVVSMERPTEPLYIYINQKISHAKGKLNAVFSQGRFPQSSHLELFHKHRPFGPPNLVYHLCHQIGPLGRKSQKFYTSLQHLS